MDLADLAEEQLLLNRADPLALTGREPECLHDLGIPEGGGPLRLEGDLTEPYALGGRQDRVDLRLVGASLFQGQPHTRGGGSKWAGSPKVSIHRLRRTMGEVGDLRPLPFVESQVIMCRRLSEEEEFPRGAEHRQVSEDRFDPPRGVSQLGLRVRVAPSLLDELTVIRERRREDSPAEPLHARSVCKLPPR